MQNNDLLQKLKFDSAGLIPAVVQDYFTREVLMVGYMNKESLSISMEEGRTCFYSRSRQELWRKGETSGHVQRIISIKADCDYDTLVVQVQKAGPVCHTGKESCFFNELYGDAAPDAFSIDKLYALIGERKTQMPKDSYTTYLFEKGKEKILKKVGEECAEVIIGGMKENQEEVIFEVADLCYHVLVLLCEMGISPEQIRQELNKRHVIDKKTKQEPMQ